MMMKRVFFLGTMIFLLAWACSPLKNASKSSALIEPDPKDSTEYDLVISDIHFDQWYMLNYSEAKDRTDEFYHSKNLVAVANWNGLFQRGQYLEVIDSWINYQPQIDYGIDLNRKLYWYFKFVEDYYGIRLF
jgi:hypothetical protein